MSQSPPRVSFTTLGCRLNQAESDSMAEELSEHGVQACASEAEPDVVVINTCTVTREATKASRQAIRRAAKKHPDAKIVVIGCYAVSDPDEVASIDGVDLVLTNDDKERFSKALGSHSSTAPLLTIGGPSVRAEKPVERVRVNLKAQTGCDEWCTFCIIPKTRGPLRSLDEDDLLVEARARVSVGAREIVLTGVHLGKYTYDAGGDERDLVRLFRRLLEIEGLRRLRLSSILSRHLTPDVIDFIANEPRMCRHLHVPLQSGDDGVLAAMNRPYRIAEYLESIERVKARIPGVALATDIIVGFPGESEVAFAATMEVVRHVEFSKLHVFRYSARPDTAAAGMKDVVAPEIKKDRSKRLIALGNDIRGRFLEEHLLTPLHVLVEEERQVDGVGICSGQTDDYVRVWFEGSDLLGEVVDVDGVRVRADGVEGRLLSQPDAVLVSAGPR
ncbi:MAG: tRNA (N(6)-L-threonylcarbamoyladenosine(37)-C(2))-methylthiotransferase MtaB [Actinomycetota bacterium]|nr:tRNA (N(6)-L-threonylcarbamoyladenosine(37)-C(2))-methylthiotransferase MtaB [Actinomycetota bacterium]